ncbi:MAG: oxygenase MpaB family protein [Nocardioides sp.]
MIGHADGAEAAFGLAEFVGEAVLLAGAGSAVMYQLARKEVGLGVVEHSTTLDRPLDRLRTTLTYVYVMALGSEEERLAVAAMVDRRHALVRSAGRYSAFDPELQLWVAATLARTGETIRERVFGPMDPATRERVYRESWVLGTALQVSPEMWPPTRAAFEDYWEAAIAVLSPDPAVQGYARRLLSTRSAPLLVRPVQPLQSLVTRGNLDARTRDVLALPWSSLDQSRYDRFWRLVPPVYRRVPEGIRQLPSRLVMADLRRRLRSGRRVI